MDCDRWNGFVGIEARETESLADQSAGQVLPLKDMNFWGRTSGCRGKSRRKTGQQEGQKNCRAPRYHLHGISSITSHYLAAPLCR
jgi:hypothetical protein